MGSEKRENNYFFKLNIKDDYIFYYALLIKKLFSNCQTTYQKELYLLFKYNAYFHRVNIDSFSAFMQIMAKVNFLNQAESFISESYICQLHGNANKKTRR